MSPRSSFESHEPPDAGLARVRFALQQPGDARELGHLGCRQPHRSSHMADGLRKRPFWVRESRYSNSRSPAELSREFGSTAQTVMNSLAQAARNANSDETCHPLRSKVGHGFRWPVASDLVATDQARCANQAERVAMSHHLAFDRSAPGRA